MRGVGYVNLTREFAIKEEDVVDWPPKEWLTIPPLMRVVYDDPKTIRAVLRDLSARDRDIELLDIDRIQYGFLMYDRSLPRKALKSAGVAPLKPYVHWVSKSWALDMIEQIS